MLLNSSFTYLELHWVNLYETIRRLYYAQDDGQSSQSNPAILYSRLLPVVPHFSPAFSIPPFTRCHSRIPHSRFLPIAEDNTHPLFAHLCN